MTLKMKKILIGLAIGLVACANADPAQQLICRLTNISNAQQIATKYQITLSDTAYGPFALYTVSGSVNSATVQAQLQADPMVVWAEDDQSLSTPEAQKGSTIAAIVDRNALYAENKGILNQIHWSSALANEPGRGVRIAILDTGLSKNTGSLWKKVADAVDLVEPGMPWDMPHNTDSNNNGIVDEATGHGTMVAGIIDQVAPLASFVIVRVADSDGNSTAWRIIKGLTRAVVAGAEVANISLGSMQRIPALTDVLDWTEAHNLVICAPVGNDDIQTSRFPAQISKVISVAGVDPNDVKASFSNWWGGTLSCAPATGIKSFFWNGSMAVWSGTSFASPFVAAVIADSLRKTGSVPTQQIRNCVQADGDSVDSLNRSFAKSLGMRLDMIKLEIAIITSNQKSP